MKAVYNINAWMRGSGDGSFGKVFALQAWGSEFNPQMWLKNKASQAWWWETYNLSAEEAETGGSLVLAGQPA